MQRRENRVALRQLMLFLGAGASAPAGLPLVREFFEHVDFPPDRGFRAACLRVAQLIEAEEGRSAPGDLKGYDAENLFGRLEMLSQTEALLQHPLKIPVSATTNIGVSPRELLDFLKREVVRIYGKTPPSHSLPPVPTRAPDYQPLLGVLHMAAPIEDPLRVLTTNYDTLVEEFFSSKVNSEWLHQGYRAKLVTGFSESGSRAFRPQTFAAKSAPGERLVHFIKLHGSVSWKLQRRLGGQTVVETGGFTAPTGEHDCVLYFGYKSVPQEEPFKTLHNQLKDGLLRPGTMIVIGFQFADPYIRETFDFALRANKTLRLICCLRRSPESNTPLKNLMEAFPEQISVLRGRDKEPVPFGDRGFYEALRAALEESGSG
jgi:hypothetical protein